jgi:hypothetical protein
MYCSRQKTSLATSGTAMVILNKIVQNQEEGKSRDPLAALMKVVTIPRKLNKDHLKFYLTLELGKKMERNGINKSNGAKGR